MEKNVLEGKVALVTGAGQGIGEAVALRLAADGADIVAADINLDAVRTTAAKVRDAGRRAMEVRVDVTTVPQLQAMVDSAVREFGRIDILVACAGVAQIRTFLDTTEADWDRVMDVNARGLFFTNQLVARQMIKQGGGAIVNISSIAGRRSCAHMPHYGASKAAVISLTWSAAAALAPYGITVNAVCPAIVGTAMWGQLDHEMAELRGLQVGEYTHRRLKEIPLRRMETPEDVANAIAFLVSPAASYITGETLNVDGGVLMN